MEYFAIGLFALFTVKHIVADYILQFSWMIRDKGFYGEIGGIAHSGMHAFLTLFVLLLANTGLHIILLTLLSILDGVIHYHVDWVKSNIVKRNGLFFFPSFIKIWYVFSCWR